MLNFTSPSHSDDISYTITPQSHCDDSGHSHWSHHAQCQWYSAVVHINDYHHHFLFSQPSAQCMCRRLCSEGSSKMYQISLVFCVAVEWNMWDKRDARHILSNERDKIQECLILLTSDGEELKLKENTGKIPSSRVSLVFWISLSRVLPSTWQCLLASGGWVVCVQCWSCSFLPNW